MNDETTGVPRPNWADWRDMEAVALWAAVALSLDLDPLDIQRVTAPRRWAGSRPDTTYPLPANLREAGKRRLRIAESHVAGGKTLRRIESAPATAPVQVNLREFGTWAALLDWELPPEFPRVRQSAPAPALPISISADFVAEEDEVDSADIPGDVQKETAPVQAVSATARNHLPTRQQQLDPIFKMARDQAVDPNDEQAVWNALVELAKTEKPPSPLREFHSKGVIYAHKNGSITYLTRKDFHERWTRLLRLWNDHSKHNAG